ncbi:MAG: response regulator transcription factor [Acidimicrobiales bacterium]
MGIDALPDAVAPFGDDPASPTGAGARHGEGASTRAIDSIPSELRRIADLIETAGILAPVAEATTALGLTAATDLSPRQWEIVRRLVDGERVTSIAAAMYLSRSTIRNHLSAVFAKVGVHSQDELIALYRRDAALGPPAADGTTNRPSST